MVVVVLVRCAESPGCGSSEIRKANSTDRHHETDILRSKLTKKEGLAGFRCPALLDSLRVTRVRRRPFSDVTAVPEKCMVPATPN
jgi:hypothetical protein